MSATVTTTRDDWGDGAELSILVASRGPSRDLERTLRSLARTTSIGNAELLIGLYGRDGLERTRALVTEYVPKIQVRFEALPETSPEVARAAIAGLSAARWLIVMEEGATLSDQVLAQARTLLHTDGSINAVWCHAEGPSIAVLRRDADSIGDTDPLKSARAQNGRVAVVDLPAPLTEARPVTRLPNRLEGEFEQGLPRIRLSSWVRVLLLADFCAAAFYLSWWLQPGHVGTPILFGALAVAEAFNLLHVVGLWWTVWMTKVESPPRPTRSWTIDVFITTCGEPLDVLRRTVVAAVALDRDHRTFVLDDARRPEVRLLCAELSAEYVTRGGREGAKAGNLNHALLRTDGELVAVFDADHVPHPDFLDRLVGYFEDPDLAFVQTPQYYANATREPIARGAYQQQALFYGPICRGKNGVNAAFCCGTNVLFRRRALDDVGGFDSRSVVEDFVTSMHLHRRGWHSVYYPYVLSEGLGPETLRAFFGQQFRWARGSIGGLVSGEPFKRGFSLAQRAQYLLATSFYLIGLVTTVYIALPILYLLAGWSAFSSSSGDFIFYYVPYLLLGLATIRWGLGGQLRFEHLRYTFGAFAVYVTAALAAFTRLRARFSATGSVRRGGTPVYAYAALGAFGLTSLAIIVGLGSRPLDPRTFTNVSWACVNLVLLSGIVAATVSRQVATPAAAAPALDAVPRLPEHTLPNAWRERLYDLVLAETAIPRIAALTALGFALRLALSGTQSIRLDESLSLREARLPFAVMMHNLFTWDVHPPLYYTLLHGWVLLAGTSEFSLRLPSAVFGAAAVPLLYFVARRLTSERGATFAAAIGAAAPFWVWHSDEARMYTLLLAFSLAALLSLFRACERDRTRDWVLYGLVTGISLYTHYFAALMLPVHGMWFVLQGPARPPIRRWLLALGSAAALLSVWLATMVVHDGLGAVSSIETGVVVPAQNHGLLAGAYSVFVFLLVYFVGYGQGIGHDAGTLGLASRMLAGSWPLIALVGVASQRLGSWLRSRAAAFLGFWIIFTLATVYALNLWKGNVFMQRYLIIVSPALFIVVAIGLSRVIRSVVVGATIIVATLSLATVAENYDSSNPAREDWRGAAATVTAATRPGDAVAILPWFYVTPFDYYFRGSDPVRGIRLGSGAEQLTAQRRLTALADAHRGHDLWVATAYESVFDPKHVIRSSLARSLIPVTVYHLPGEVVLRRYRVPSTGPRPLQPLTGLTTTRLSTLKSVRPG
jgi:cellulose synthase (UDP-forming)